MKGHRLERSRIESSFTYEMLPLSECECGWSMVGSNQDDSALDSAEADHIRWSRMTFERREEIRKNHEEFGRPKWVDGQLNGEDLVGLLELIELRESMLCAIAFDFGATAAVSISGSVYPGDQFQVLTSATTTKASSQTV